MAVGIGASSVLGVAFEVTPGTYVPPVKFIPFESENIQYQQDTQWRRPLRNTPGLIGATPGNVHVEGDVDFEFLADCVLYFLYASRCTPVKTGAGPYTYVFTPQPVATPAKTLSIAVRRNGEVMGYTGCVVSAFSITIGEDSKLKFKATIVGSNEASQAALSAITWPTTTVFGAGMYNMQIPTSTQVFDTDNFEFSSEDNATPQYRMRSAGNRGAQFVSFGESAGTIKVNRDFETRADYDTFKALTAQSITLTATNGVDTLTILAPAAIKDTYEINLGGQGDIIRASVGYQLAIDATGKHYTVTIICAENIV